jgi:hypothetical protein
MINRNFSYYHVLFYRIKNNFMKKLGLILMMLPLLHVTSFAQQTAKSPLRFGLKGGLNLSRAGISNGAPFGSVSNSFGPGFFAGGLLEVSGPAGSKFKGQVEALYSFHTFTNRFTVAGLSTEPNTNLSQISVPVMVRYFPIPSLSVNAGASANVNIASKTDVGPLTYDNADLDYLQPVQIGILVGATYYIHKGFFVDARYNYYFGSIFKDSSVRPSYNLSAIQLGIGYKF